MILFGPIHLNLKVSSIFASLIAVTIIACKSLDMLPDILISQLEWIGDRSYSIYLVHMPLLYVAKYSPLTEIENVENRIVQSTIAVVSSILLGALSYSKIENRYRDRGERDVSSIKNIVIAIVLTVAIPLTLFVGMDIGVKKQYWGLDRNIPVPSYAGDLDPKCELRGK
jgi:peptidoglycan/LPS O-acetylase OafA/YrhL